MAFEKLCPPPILLRRRVRRRPPVVVGAGVVVGCENKPENFFFTESVTLVRPLVTSAAAEDMLLDAFCSPAVNDDGVVDVIYNFFCFFFLIIKNNKIKK
jgi:hypothetical protein